jgi:glycosyltransferase involved in cell wall biosynthesis
VPGTGKDKRSAVRPGTYERVEQGPSRQPGEESAVTRDEPAPYDDPLVTVVLPTYERADLVERAIDSVLAQTFPNFELVVVDDASGDETPAVVRGYDDNRVEYIRHEVNRHVSAARNTGIARAKGRYVAFLDDDDEWLPTKLEKQVVLLEEAPEHIGLAYCWMDYVDGDEVIEEYRPTLRGEIFEQTLAGQPIGSCSTLLVRASVIDEVGGFDEDLPRGNDGDFIRRVCREYHVDYVPEVLVRYRTGHGEKRITREDREGIENAIRANRAKLDKFEDDLRRYPSARAAVLSTLGWRYGQLGDWRASLGYFARAARADPTERELYLNAARTAYYHTARRFLGG